MHDLHLSMAPDTGLSLAERLDRFDEKREREVGDTDLLRARNLERETGLHQIYLKFEGGNPTGTQKDRIAFAQVGDALRRGFETVCAATCGNYGVAVALAGRLAGLKVHVTFPATYTGRRVKELEELGAQITRAGADYEEAVLASRAHASSIEGYDANPGGANAALQLKAYGEIAWEIYDVLRDAPRAVAVPVSNGSTLAGVHKGFVSLHRRGKTSRIPIVVAGSAAHQNPIVESWQKKLETCVDLDPAKIHETRTNEPLINWQALDGEAALEAVYGTKGWAGDVSDRKMQKMARLLREVQGLDVLPAATAGLVALLDAHAESPLPEDRYVVVLTGEERMSEGIDVAVVYCDGHFQDPNGKTAHGLVRFTRRYQVLAVIDRATAGQDAGQVLDGKPRGIPLVADLAAAIELGRSRGTPPTHLVIGVAPDGGRMDDGMKAAVRQALEAGLNVDSGLHDFLTDMPEMVALAARTGRTLRDVRKPPPRSELHGFTGKIEQVKSRVIALLGTDSAVGKRTTAWMLVDALRAAGHSAEMIGTGQTGWMQGARFGIVLDSLVNDFVAGELEHACWRAWTEAKPDFLVVEGQGSLMNPAYPGGLEILAATRPECIVLQHAPARVEYDGFPGYPMHPLDHQIHALELVSGRPVIAVTVNQESLVGDQIDAACRQIEETTGLPTCAPIRHGVARVVEALGVR